MYTVLSVYLIILLTVYLMITKCLNSHCILLIKLRLSYRQLFMVIFGVEQIQYLGEGA